MAKYCKLTQETLFGKIECKAKVSHPDSVFRIAISHVPSVCTANELVEWVKDAEVGAQKILNKFVCAEIVEE